MGWWTVAVVVVVFSQVRGAVVWWRTVVVDVFVLSQVGCGVEAVLVVVVSQVGVYGVVGFSFSDEFCQEGLARRRVRRWMA